MNFDFKMTTWERVTVPHQYEQEVLSQLKLGKITYPHEIDDLVETLSNMKYTADRETLLDYTEPMSVEENEGFRTIEVVAEDSNILWDNSKI